MGLNETGAVERELAELRGRVERLEQELGELREAHSIAAESTVQSQGSLKRVHELPPVTLEVEPASAQFAVVARVGNERSLEDRLGSQVFNRVGIIALLIGATWFLKWAIDNHWIGEMGRVAIGLLAGGGLIAWSERFRARSYAGFSYSLKAVGTGVLYLSLWAGFQLYHLMPASVALGAMVLVTAWNAFMAWSQDAEILAAYALVGGFASPALVSSGGNHEVFLLSYLLVMNLAVLTLVWAKPWARLMLGSMPATMVYFIAWYVAWFRADAAGITGVFVVLLAASMAAVAMLAVQRDGVIAGVIAPMGAASFAALAGYSVLQDSGGHGWLPWEMVLLAAVYLALERWQRVRTKPEPAASVYLALAVVFLTIAIPLKATGRWITVGWLAEGVALTWVAARMARMRGVEGAPDVRVARLLQWLACGALLLGWCGAACQGFAVEHVVFSAGFATEVMGVAAMAFAAWLAWGARGDDAAWLRMAGAAMIAGNLLALLAGVRAIQTYWGSGDALAQALAVSAFLMVYGAALLAAGFWRRMAFVRWQGLVLLVCAIFKVFLYDMRSLSSGYRVMSFIGLGALLMAVSFAYQRDWLALRKDSE